MNRTIFRLLISSVIATLIAIPPVSAVAFQGDLTTYPASIPQVSTSYAVPASYSPSRERLWGMSRTHRYLGYATAVAGLVAGVSSSSESFHKAAGFTTAGLAAAAWGTGVIQYGSLIDLSKGITRYNVHAALTTLATIGFIITVSKGNSDKSHGGIGIASEAAMVIPIAILRW